MKIEHTILELRTRHAFHIARAAAPPVRRTVWLRLIDSDGVEGWGEAAANPYYGETADTVVALVPVFRDALTESAQDPFAHARAEVQTEVAGQRTRAPR